MNSLACLTLAVTEHPTGAQHQHHTRCVADTGIADAVGCCFGVPVASAVCSIGQNLAKLELQVVLATLMSRFRFSPGPELEQELKLAAAIGQPVVAAVHALAGAFVTLQPMSGPMVLKISSRA
jgi:hypothetical protein